MRVAGDAGLHARRWRFRRRRGTTRRGRLRTGREQLGLRRICSRTCFPASCQVRAWHQVNEKGCGSPAWRMYMTRAAEEPNGDCGVPPARVRRRLHHRRRLHAGSAVVRREEVRRAGAMSAPCGEMAPSARTFIAAHPATPGDAAGAGASCGGTAAVEISGRVSVQHLAADGGREVRETIAAAKARRSMPLVDDTLTPLHREQRLSGHLADSAADHGRIPSPAATACSAPTTCTAWPPRTASADCAACPTGSCPNDQSGSSGCAARTGKSTRRSPTIDRVGDRGRGAARPAFSSVCAAVEAFGIVEQRRPAGEEHEGNWRGWPR